jgi:hypothetical protein
MASPGWHGERVDLEGETKPMEGSSGRTLATATCHDGLVSGAKPLSRLLREVSTSSDVGPPRWVQAQRKGEPVASVTGFGWQLSGGRPDILWSDSQEPSQLLVGFDCPPRHWRFGTDARRAISCDKDGSFGPRLRSVLGDVGVRFGGSEHHRIDTSSSHTRPPARKGRDSRPPGAGQPAFLLTSCARSLASCMRRSSEHRALGSTRDIARPLRRAGGFHRGRHSELFGAS